MCVANWWYKMLGLSRLLQELSLESSRQLEEDREQMVALKQQEMDELTAKCVAAEEERRRAEEERMEMERKLAVNDGILRDVLKEKGRLESKFEQYCFSQEELVRNLTGI